MDKKSLLIVESGETAPVANSILRGAILEARKSSWIDGIYGAKFGFDGLLNNEIVNLEELEKDDLNLLMSTPGSFLGTSERDIDLPGDGASIKDRLHERGIGYLLLIGDRKSISTALLLSSYFLTEGEEIQVLVVPKGVNNSIPSTDHSLGYPSAAKHLLNAVKGLAIDLRSRREGEILLLETPGAWLTASPFVLEEESRPDLIYLPGTVPGIDSVVGEIKAAHEAKGRVLALVEANLFGDAKAVETLTCKLRENGLSPKSLVFGASLRSDPLSLSPLDVWEAEASSRLSVMSFKGGESGKMVSIKREASHPYESSFELVPLGRAMGEVHSFPPEWVVSSREVNPLFLDYLLPLVSGEVPLEMKDGVYQTFSLPNGSKR